MEVCGAERSEGGLFFFFFFFFFFHLAMYGLQFWMASAACCVLFDL
jgi:hypothetical protein